MSVLILTGMLISIFIRINIIMPKTIEYEVGRRTASESLTSTKWGKPVLNAVKSKIGQVDFNNKWSHQNEPTIQLKNIWVVGSTFNFFNWENGAFESREDRPEAVYVYNNTYQVKYLNGVNTNVKRNESRTLLRTEWKKVIIENARIMGGWEGAAFYLVDTNLPGDVYVKVIEHQSGQSNIRKTNANGEILMGRYNDAGSNLDSWITVEVLGHPTTRSNSRHVNSGGNWRNFRGIPFPPDSNQLYNDSRAFVKNFPANIGHEWRRERWSEEYNCYMEERGSNSRQTVEVCSTRWVEGERLYIGGVLTRPIQERNVTGR